MADFQAIPNPPALDLSAMSIADLRLLADFFWNLSEAGMAIRNQPRCWGKAADFLRDYQCDYINGVLDGVRDELRYRVPLSEIDAEIRAECLVRHLSGSESPWVIALIALSAVNWDASGWA